MNQQHTAIHEAGHAVIARVLGMACGQATVKPDCDLGEAGHAIIHDQWATWGQWEDRRKYREIHTVVQGRIISSMAGAEAEREILGYCAGGDGDDRDQIEMMASSSDSGIEPEAWPRWELRMRRQCRRLVRKHRSKIIRVAAALECETTLLAKQIDELVAE